MELLELPPEVIHVILVYATLSRGIKRTLRLRLVCKFFADAIYPALFETRIMDNFHSNPIGSDLWQIRNQHANKLWHKYLVYRVKGEKDATVGRFVEIRQIAQAICEEMESELDLNPTIESLCWLALSHRATIRLDRNKWWYQLPKNPGCRAHLRLDTLLSAAAHFDLLPLAKQLIGKGRSPTSYNYLFAPPIQVAAQSGNVTMLKLFQEQLPKSIFEPLSITGAAIRGDIDIVKLSLPTSTQQGESNNCGIQNQQSGKIERTSETGKAILKARSYTSNPEVYSYLTSFLAPWPTSSWSAHEDLIQYAELGDISMVRYLLHLGVPLQVSGYFESPLVMACRGSHNDVVDLLLEHGADPNYAAQKLNPIFPLHEPATAGNLSLVRRLLDTGALPNRPEGRPTERLPVLWWAFARENTDMIQLLLEHGASLDGATGDMLRKGWVGESLAELTYDLGYDSMAEILRKHGFEIAGSSARLPKGYHFWSHWADAEAPASRVQD